MEHDTPLIPMSLAHSSPVLASEEPRCHYGCLADAFEYRALPRFLYKAYTGMTVEKCHQAAINRSYTIFAVQFGRE
jgi:hypothetical protein